MERASGRIGDTQIRHLVTALTPPSTQQTSVEGALSDGILVTFLLPPPGTEFSEEQTTELTKLWLQGRNETMGGLEVRKSYEVTITERPAMVLETSFVELDGAPEPQKNYFIVLRSAKYIMVIEMAAPVSKSKEYKFLFDLLLLRLFELTA